MKSIFWNVRGISNSPTRLALKNLCVMHKPDLGFIAEPWMEENKLHASFWKFLNMRVFAVNQRGSLQSNLWCVYSESLNPVVIVSSDQHVYFSIDIIAQLVCLSTAYASTSVSESLVFCW